MKYRNVAMRFLQLSEIIFRDNCVLCRIDEQEVSGCFKMLPGKSSPSCESETLPESYCNFQRLVRVGD